jgi:hypothetical protein
MIKTVLKLVVAALLVLACWRSANVFLKYYKFKDAVHETVLFSSARSDSQIQSRVLEQARQLDVPVQPENITVRRVENRTIIDATYTDQVELLPTKFYPWNFKMEVEAFNANMPTPDDVTAPGR